MGLLAPLTRSAIGRCWPFSGIRGIGSFYYLAYGLNPGDFGVSDRVWALTGFIVLCSIVIHAVTSTPLMRLIDRRERPDHERQEKARGYLIA